MTLGLKSDPTKWRPFQNTPTQWTTTSSPQGRMSTRTNLPPWTARHPSKRGAPRKQKHTGNPLTRTNTCRSTPTIRRNTNWLSPEQHHRAESNQAQQEHQKEQPSRGREKAQHSHPTCSRSAGETQENPQQTPHPRVPQT